MSEFPKLGTILFCGLLPLWRINEPWWFCNVVIFHAFDPFATTVAHNLYLGNDPRNRDAGIDWRATSILRLSQR
jgi:hypothetical protein